jgi:hypothetical protein
MSLQQAFDPYWRPSRFVSQRTGFRAIVDAKADGSCRGIRGDCRIRPGHGPQCSLPLAKGRGSTSDVSVNTPVPLL